MHLQENKRKITMQTYADFEKLNAAALKAEEKKRTDCVACPKCESQWFQQFRVGRFVSDHNVILGQEVPAVAGEMNYVMLKCIRCDELLEPRILHSTRDLGGDAYDQLLDTLDGGQDNKVEVKS
jgi:hypothetical protein